MLEPGQSLSHYRLIEKIGEGGMGAVWKAVDTRLDRHVALKVLPARVAGDPKALARFEREARAVAALSHPHILAVHDVGCDDGVHFVVMELLEGETLRQRLADGPLPLRKMVEFAAQIARGLAAAHDKGIVHRDLKPDNVFVTKDGQVKILDFGLAKLDPARPGTSPDSEVATLTRHTDPGVVLGTVGYMSPEQVRGQEADARSDIFALGVVLYEMVTGNRAFSGDSSVETLNAILKEDPADLQEISREVSPALERIIRHCLEKRPEERFQSARDVAFDLEAHTDPSSSGAIEAIDDSRPTPRVRTLVWVAGAVLLAAVALTAGLLLGVRGDPPELHHAERITYREGTVFRARFVDEAGTVVFSASWDGEPVGLFVRRPQDTAPTPLDLGRADLLSVSPSGELAILTEPPSALVRLVWRTETGTLARAGLSSSAGRELFENVYDAEWSPDGERLVIVREVDGKRRLEFPPGTMLYETATGHITNPRFSPSGDRIAFFDHPAFGDNRGAVAVVDLQGKRETLSDGWGSLFGLSWSPSGDEVWLTAAPGSDLIAVATGGRHRVVARPYTKRMVLHDVSPTGKVLLASQDRRLVVRGLGPGDARERDLSWLDRTQSVGISADGTRLLLSEQSDAMMPDYAVALREMDGATPVKIGEGWPIAFSPDGKWVLSVLPDEPNQAVLLPTGAGEARTIALDGSQIGPLFFSADGERILGTTLEEGKTRRSYSISLDGKESRPLLPKGHMVLGASRDGKWLFCYSRPPSQARGSGKFERHPVGGGEPRPFKGFEPPEDRVMGESADGRFFMLRDNGFTAEVFLLDPETGERTLWKELTPPGRAGFLGFDTPAAVNPDGTAYAYGYSRELSELYVVEGLR